MALYLCGRIVFHLEGERCTLRSIRILRCFHRVVTNIDPRRLRCSTISRSTTHAGDIAIPRAIETICPCCMLVVAEVMVVAKIRYYSR